MTSLQIFSGKLSTISEHSNELFFLGVCICCQKFWTAGLQRFEKKGQFSKRFFGIFEILDDPFLSGGFSECIYILSPVVGCRLYSRNSRFLFWQQPVIFIRTNLSINIALQVTVKIITFKACGYGNQFQRVSVVVLFLW